MKCNQKVAWEQFAATLSSQRAFPRRRLRSAPLRSWLTSEVYVRVSYRGRAPNQPVRAMALRSLTVAARCGPGGADKGSKSATRGARADQGGCPTGTTPLRQRISRAAG